MDWIAFAIFLAACFGAGTTGAIFMPGRWYEALDKPPWTPPNWLFPIAWTAIYVAIALAAARVAPLPGSHYAMAFWTLQIVLNALWTPVFFGKHSLLGGVAVIVPLWLAVVATTVLFFRFDTLAAVLMVPYVVWVSYASALNVDVWRRNPDEAALPREV